MPIAIVGIGYVGLVSAACFADLGVEVYCVDVDEAKIQRLRDGEIPIYEPGLDALVRRGVEAGRLHFSTSYRRSPAPMSRLSSVLSAHPQTKMLGRPAPRPLCSSCYR